MTNPFEIFSATGMVGIFALLFALVGTALAAFGPAAIGFTKRRWPASLSWIGLVLALLFGLVGAAMGAAAVRTALNAPPDMLQTLTASGLAEAMYTEMGALLFLGPAFILSSTCSAIPGLVRPGDGARIDIAALGGAALGAVIGTIVTAASTLFLYEGELSWIGLALYVVPFLTVIGTLNVLIASARISSDDPSEQARIVGIRGLTMASAAVGVIITGHLFASMGDISAFKAVAAASAQSKQEMLTEGMKVAAMARTFAWTLTAPILFAGLGSVLPQLRRADKRTGIGVAVAGVQLLVIIGCLIATRLAITSTFDVLSSSFGP